MHLISKPELLFSNLTTNDINGILPFNYYSITHNMTGVLYITETVKLYSEHTILYLWEREPEKLSL